MRRLIALAILAFASPVAAGPIGKPWEVCVRIQVQEGRAASLGSGTVISGAPEISYVLTCAHIFASSSGARRVTVDLFDGRMVDQQVHFLESFEATCVDFDRALDVGLVSFRPGRRLPEARPVPRGWLPVQGEQLVATGCGQGEDAIIWSTAAIKTTTLADHPGYVGIECSQEPRQGRSGGGLHRADGRTCGVLDFGSPTTDTGIYAVPASIHKLLDRNGLSSLYQETASRERRPAANAQPPAAASPQGETAEQPAGPQPQAQPPVPAWYERFHTDDPFHWGALAGALYIAFRRIRARFPGASITIGSPATPAPAGYTPQDEILLTVRYLRDRIKAMEEREASQKEASSLFDRIRELMREPSEAPPKP